jgi:hypothetical protein
VHKSGGGKARIIVIATGAVDFAPTRGQVFGLRYM